MAGDSWSVVSMVDEPREVVCAFVAHYRRLGAAEIVLCLDRPRPDLLDLLGGAEGVRLVVCDDSWWQGDRPPESVHRQIRNANRIYRTCRTDWLLHVDADEYLWLEGDVGAWLAAHAAEWPVARVAPAERVHDAGAGDAGVFDGHFRLPRPMSQADRAALYGPDARFFNAEGLLAHARGKCFTRTGLDIRIGVHQPYPVEMQDLPVAERRGWLNTVAGEFDGRIAHFDGLTPLHWLLKLIGRAETERRMRAAGQFIPPERHAPARLEQMRAAWDARHDPAALAGLTRLLCLDSDRRALLAARGLLRALSLDPAAEARAQFPDAELDFTQAGFDARLRRQRRALIEATGFAG